MEARRELWEEEMTGIGNRLKEVRKKKGLSIKKLSAMTNISAPYISQIENGHRSGIGCIVEFATALDVSADYLLDLKSKQPSPYSIP